MSQEHQRGRDLIWKYLDQSIQSDEFSELETLLAHSSELRLIYQREVELHQAFLNLNQNQQEPRTHITPLPKRPVKTWIHLLPWAAALLLASLFVWREHNSKIQVTLVDSNEADWRGHPIAIGETFSNRIMHLKRGKIALSFPSKTRAIIEGPAFFQIISNHSLELSSGLITVEHTGKPGAFFVQTPLGKVTDLGTKFGVSVGHGTIESLVMTEVLEGEITVQTSDKDPKKHYLKGESVLLSGLPEKVNYQNTFNNQEIKLNLSLDIGSNPSPSEEKNLALGKPVISTGYWNSPKNGEVFPPTAVNDGRYCDSGNPGDWSFWLAPQHQNGEFIIDLEKLEIIRRIELQNTRNRHYGDRGTENFRIEISSDGENYVEVLKDKLAPIPSWHEPQYPFISYDLQPVPARYIKFIVESHYKSPTQNNPALHGSGGLNEIRVY